MALSALSRRTVSPMGAADVVLHGRSSWRAGGEWPAPTWHVSAAWHVPRAKTELFTTRERRLDANVRGTFSRLPGRASKRADSTAPGGIDLQKSDVREEADLECVAIGQNVECFIDDTDDEGPWRAIETVEIPKDAVEVAETESMVDVVLATLLLVSPFFFWGTAMVAMKDVLLKAGPLFVAAVRLLPAGAMLVGFAAAKGRPQPSTPVAWAAITLFALVDATCFQGFLSQGLSRTSAGLGSVIIDSQPLTVALLAALLFGESIGPLGALGLATGVAGLCLLEVPVNSLAGLLGGAPAELAAGATSAVTPVMPPVEFSLWESGEWWMLLAAQSMAVGTVMVRWVCKYNDPIMATGWHMIIGGIPLLLLSAQQHDPALEGHLADLLPADWAMLAYTSVFGSAVSYGVFFYNANKGNLTRLSSLTFLTPMFAAFFGYLYLGETLTDWQLLGALITLASIFLVNFKPQGQEHSG